MIEDYGFAPKEFADLEYYSDGSDEEKTLRVRVLTRIEDEDDTYYLVSGDKETLEEIGCLWEELAGFQIPEGHGIGYVHSLELMPAHTKTFIKLMEN